MSNGYVVTHPHTGSGVGSNLESLAGAAWCARQLGRAVVVDWRNSAFLKDKSLNYFTEFFDTPSSIQGVPVTYAPCAELPDDLAPPQIAQLTPAEARHALARGDHPARWIRLHDYHPLQRLDPAGDPAARFWTMREFYRYVRPREFVMREIDAFADAHLGGAFVIGVNVSTGNGEFAKGEFYAGRVNLGIFEDEKTFLRKMARSRRRALQGLPRDLRHRSKFFVATDSFAMRDLLMKLPDAVTRRTHFPPPGVGRIYCDYTGPDYTDRHAIVDAIADMFLLARCHALIRNGSVFNAYATTVTAYFGGNVQHIEKLYASYWVKAARQIVKVRLGR
jgi:hypothetical protein